jgi:serine/threonine protein kinase
MAPEVLRCDLETRQGLKAEGKAGYGPEVDCWAVGILAYECLVDQTPYESHTMGQTLELIEARALFQETDDNYDNRHARHGMSLYAKDFILGCLDVNPATRLTAHEMLSHPWWGLSAVERS